MTTTAPPASAAIENHGMRCDQRSRDSTHDACHVARGLTVSRDTRKRHDQRERRSGKDRRDVEAREQGKSVRRCSADQQPADHPDQRALDEREVSPHEAGQRGAGGERQRGVENDEQGGHPTSTQILVCWSAELCGMAVQIG